MRNLGIGWVYNVKEKFWRWRYKVNSRERNKLVNELERFQEIQDNKNRVFDYSKRIKYLLSQKAIYDIRAGMCWENANRYGGLRRGVDYRRIRTLGDFIDEDEARKFRNMPPITDIEIWRVHKSMSIKK